jgi:hypothetical protein
MKSGKDEHLGPESNGRVSVRQKALPAFAGRRQVAVAPFEKLKQLTAREGGFAQAPFGPPRAARVALSEQPFRFRAVSISVAQLSHPGF